MTNYTTKICLAVILLLAAIFRFWQIGSLPAGLFPDEAANGLDVNSILSGDAQPFYERGNGREALFFYFLAASISAFGRSPAAHHAVSAAFGFLAVGAAYFLTKRLFDARVALLASFFMAVSSYAVLITRTAFRATMVPLLSSLTLLFLVIAIQAKSKRTRLWSAAGAGLSFAGGFYTYTSFRMMLPLLALMLSVLLFGERKKIAKIYQTYRVPAVVFCAAFAAGISWLAFYFFKHPASIVGRAGQVSIFSPDLNGGDVFGTFLTVLKATLLSFFTNGDLNWRHNVSGYPFLDPAVSVFFAAGLIIFTFAIFKKRYEMTLVAAWFWLMLVPEATTAEGIPHGLRLIGVMPAIFIMAAWPAAWLWGKFKAMEWMYNFKYVLAIIFIAGIFFYNFALYFGVASASPDYHYAFRSDLTTVSAYLNERNSASATYLSLDKFSVQTVEYLTTQTGNPYILVDPAHTFELKLKPGDQVVFTQSTLYDRLKFIKSHSRAELVRTEKNKFGEIIMLVYQQP